MKDKFENSPVVNNTYSVRLQETEQKLSETESRLGITRQRNVALRSDFNKVLLNVSYRNAIQIDSFKRDRYMEIEHLQLRIQQLLEEQFAS